MNKPMRVIALNKDAKMIGQFDSIANAARYMGASYASLNVRLIKKKPYKQILFIREPEYREHWLKGTTDTLKFLSRKENIANRLHKQWKNKDSEAKKAFVERLHKNRDEWNKLNKNKKVICVETGEVYESIYDCANKNEIPKGSMNRILKHGTKRNGKTFKLLEINGN